ncbi:signal transduction histidine kinase LytS [Chryseotalea sanaruensis]|uniref:Signal transduction histidine kinase LytS n=1 Tax=Chryseotalea sanaruensis TaxID=2482724 RepID=A0A401UCH0_9BACT|nr:signal transduction histidine kinase LytS [Chryseotalea sanaruensis]
MSATKLFAQYPHYFAYDNENGLPSNEVYSIVQDKRGLIWIGCDAGLYKFDGVNYTLYSSKTQNSKSISNLTLSSDGKIYCVNFQDQIFYLENDTLRELQHTFQKISNIASGREGLLYLNHATGISVYNPHTREWRNINTIKNFTRSVVSNSRSEIYSITQQGIAKILEEKVVFYPFPGHGQNISTDFLLGYHGDKLWIVKKDGSAFYVLQQGRLVQNESKNLALSLQNRKITNLKALPDNNLWISTYNGIVRYNVDKDSVTVFYPELSFSDMWIDRENNYWLTTLQAGILRVPDLNYQVWNTPSIQNEKLTHLATDGAHIYFSSINGAITKLNTNNGSLQTFHTGKNADIECLFFDTSNDNLIFYIQSENYVLRKNEISKAPFHIKAIKSIVHAPPFYFLGSSLGLYVDSENQSYSYRDKISEAWIRQLAWNQQKHILYAATNKGLQIFEYRENQWVCTSTLLTKTQIISIDFDEATQNLFAITFNGKVHLLDTENKLAKVAELPADVQAQKLEYYQRKLFMASNKGVWILDLEKSEWNNFNALSGLASENVNDLIVMNENIWLATGKGLQKIPLKEKTNRPLAKVFLKTNTLINPALSNVKLSYQQPLILYPEASIYTSNGHFEYAYRLNQNEWIKLPAGVEQIEIQNLPTGDFEIALKVIDHLGRDSENTILIAGFVNPPVWKRWWFMLSVVFVLIGLMYWFYKHQLSKQRKELNRQNELNIAKLVAIRSQMNPHFIFNSLNSIQDLILQKKTVESYDYVVLFSELVRNALTYSNTEFIPMQKEVDFLYTYLQLEKLRFKSDFTYTIYYDQSDEIDVPSLLIQPFVENALLHGLLHIEDKKELSIRFIYDKEKLVCIVEDNGIGRKQADIIRSRQGNSHSSFALNAIQKRLDIFNEQQGEIVSEFGFEDVYPDRKYTGTRVTIKLPFKRHY